MLIEILGYAFLVIFVLTAILTLASLPGWINIPENYQKVLFKTLVLEVVGAIVVLFTSNYLNGTDGPTQLTIQPNPGGWAIIGEDGSVLQPTLTIKDPDTTFALGPDTETMRRVLTNLKYSGQLTSSGLLLHTNDNQALLGQLSASELKQIGLFNTIDSHQGEIAGSTNYSLVKFIKGDDGKWVRSGAFLSGSPFSVRVFDLGTKTIYEIHDSQKEEVVFSSSRSSEPLFNVDNRKLHFYQHESNFYLLRITEADLSGDKKFVHFLQIKFRPALETE